MWLSVFKLMVGLGQWTDRHPWLQPSRGGSHNK